MCGVSNSGTKNEGNRQVNDEKMMKRRGKMLKEDEVLVLSEGRGGRGRERGRGGGGEGWR